MTYASLYQNSQLIQRISIERIREETNKILLSGCPGRGIKLLYNTGLFQYVLPEVCSFADFDQYSPHHHKDVLNPYIGIDNILDVSTSVEILNNEGELVLQNLQNTPIKGRLRKVSKADR